MISTGDKVKVVRIIDQFKAEHLVNLQNKKGKVISWVNYQGKMRYKVLFQDGINFSTHHLLEEELEVIE